MLLGIPTEEMHEDNHYTVSASNAIPSVSVDVSMFARKSLVKHNSRFLCLLTVVSVFQIKMLSSFIPNFTISVLYRHRQKLCWYTWNFSFSTIGRRIQGSEFHYTLYYMEKAWTHPILKYLSLSLSFCASWSSKDDNHNNPCEQSTHFS